MSRTSLIELKKLIQNLPNKSSSGWDDINNLLLKEIADPIIAPLVELFNESISKGEFPECMKLAEVVPLHKGKEMYLADNYRPISLLLTLSKMLEKIVYRCIYNFLNGSNQLYDSQYGFRTAKSCENAVSELVGCILKVLEKKKHTVGIFLDLSKAFNSLEHQTIFAKLECYGIRGTSLDWFKSYLTNRRMRVKCKAGHLNVGTRSEIFGVNYGCPQGSCLGPLIFLIFANDLQYNITFLQSIQFADDTTLYVSGRNKAYLEHYIAIDLNSIQDWFRANKLTLNIRKSVCIIFSPKGLELNLSLHLKNVPILVVKVTKFLGIWLDGELNWKSHVDRLKTVINTKLGMLRRGKYLLTTHARKILYYAQIHSHLQYGLINWGNMLSHHQLNQLHKLQNKCVQLINPYLHVENNYQTYKIPKLHQMIWLGNVKLWHQCSLGTLPKNLAQSMTSDHNEKSLIASHKYLTRGRKVPRLPNIQNKLYYDSFLFKGLSDYMKLNADIRNIKKISVFVSMAKELALTMCQ